MSLSHRNFRMKFFREVASEAGGMKSSTFFYLMSEEGDVREGEDVFQINFQFHVYKTEWKPNRFMECTKVEHWNVHPQNALHTNGEVIC